VQARRSPRGARHMNSVKESAASRGHLPILWKSVGRDRPQFPVGESRTALRSVHVPTPLNAERERETDSCDFLGSRRHHSWKANGQTHEMLMTALQSVIPASAAEGAFGASSTQ
jgi:hypothetical protein